MSKRNKSVTEGATEAEVVSIKTGKSIAQLPLDEPNPLTPSEIEAIEQAKEAERQAKNEAENALRAQLKAAEDERVAALQAKLETALKQHQEKASLAFELLKSIMGQKTETVLAGTAFKLIVKNVFSLVDTFKQEIDDRYTAEVQTITHTSTHAVDADTASTTVN